MKNPKIDVIATTISGSIRDWGKVKYILPLFNKHGFTNVRLFTCNSHKEVRIKTNKLIKDGTRFIISAGGSGTFNSVLEGCCDSGINLNKITLGFLRKGSADLIGKVLGMPDEINEAIKVFADSIKAGSTVKCDVILARTEGARRKPRHFVGYGGAEIFGEIPYFSETKFTKYYKGIIGQLFGDLGPFLLCSILSLIRNIVRSVFKGKRKWEIIVNNKKVAEGYFQTFIIVNGDLGKALPLAKSKLLGSGEFYLFTIRDIGILKLFNQMKNTWNTSILDNPDKWGFNSYSIKDSLKLVLEGGGIFETNIDGATMLCDKYVIFNIVDQINLISRC